jgi:hypothetical protein
VLTPRLMQVARQLAQGDVWDDADECFDAHRLTPAEADAVCQAIARGLPRPGDGTDQPSLTVDDEGWGFPVTPGTQQPTLW